METTRLHKTEYGLRFFEIAGDSMSPTLRRSDFVLAAPAHRYTGEGCYLIADRHGEAPAAFDCSVARTRGEPMIRLGCRNHLYREQLVPRAYFDSHVVGEIVMTCNVLRHDLLARARREVEA